MLRTSGTLMAIAFFSLKEAYASSAVATTGSIEFVGPDYYKIAFALCFVIVLVLVFGFFLKKIQQFSIHGKTNLKVVSGLNIGVREKVILIQVGEKQLLVGIAPGTIRTLMILDEPLAEPDIPASLKKSTFTDILHKACSRGEKS